ncbi:transcriptional regulator [Streptomyces violarus]|uniref:Plasmid maintenance system antidote protein VapI n=1 Tax=Streptomyces violarus TaxID=67380 RepID=A0A7W4ZQ80_9ACTN|nr:MULTISPECIES: transcriptional regulator [Streptomyces]MBB3076649.1 plasmid maintenance system antidote protein VapI [Streptomyces violarus]WRT99437.1 helix-turn-helix domain-containing protein [Streptomyces sp. CGMCC 4.1772]GHD32329.1 transcriptional regulator [Streptomyces violarus]
MSEGTAAAEFAALLGELKERSGLSYGVLAKRLHMSTSTLHRYCNGDAVPADYAPVERLARLCKASSEELVELHRRWVLADAGRGRKGVGGSSEPAVAVAPVADGPASVTEAPAPVAEVPAPVADASASEAVPAAKAPSGAGLPGEPEEGAAERSSSRRPRPALLAGVAVALVLGGVGLAVAVPSGGADDDGRRGAAAVSDGGRTPDGGSVASASPSGSSSAGSSKDKDKEKGKGKGRDAASATPGSRPPAAGAGSGRPGRTTEPTSGPVPLTVNTTPHAWESPCSQRYLVNRPPGQVGPPPLEQDAPAWVAATGAVPSGQQFLKLTVQGTGKETVVVDGLTVRMAGKRAPLAWNDYAMGYPGVGCGGGVPTRFFTVALDAARPSLVPEAGHDDFPFSVSQSDPEVYYIRADASAYDVDWYLELSWSSGSRSGTLTVDDKGRPFRTSGNNGRPAYEFPLGGDKWVEAGTTE